ncbi:MAG TPA: helix-turn-helix transcriptional regulator [Thermoanaerobaculia bacterium]|nr:helix-turn-helix transcriptional regulator [Thermoanaerobaculia bacterium]
MLHEEIREARIKAGMSQMKLAELAGIQRSLVQNLENGRNVTIDTLRKVVPHLPQLESLDVGPFKLITSGAAELRDGVRQMMASGQRILDILDEERLGKPRETQGRNEPDAPIPDESPEPE